MEARCQCGSVTFKTPLPQPLALYICHCDACRRQTGSAFGTSAIFPRFELPDTDLLSVYSRPTASGHQLYCYFCRKCGTRLIHSTPSKNVISVKGGCLDGLDWKRAIHIWTKTAMVPIPEGSETHSEESGYTDYGSTQEELDQPGDLVGSSGCNMPVRQRASSSAGVNGDDNMSG
ncbi:glutathione-dependent formaldehyde-activating [Fusarium sp. NRRL 52700]|nr:glutathione-dependent formaldehyde-activating [Fusarium sp. NRRL 52700]